MKLLISTFFTLVLIGFAGSSYGQDVERAESIIDGLTSLAEFHEQGILTDEEFSAAKRRLLGLSSTARQEEPVPAETDGNNNLETINFSNATYVGQVKDGKRHGQGTTTFFDGNVYVGEYNDGNRKRGTLTYPDGKNYYTGDFNKDNNMHGSGTLYLDGRTFKGVFTNLFSNLSINIDKIKTKLLKIGIYFK